jgi:hypothetical protein
LAGCNKTADKGKTEDQLVSGGFTKAQAQCITDDVWDKVPKSDRDKLTGDGAQLTDTQKTIFLTATVKCARDKVVEQFTSGLTSITPAQITCITGKLTDADLVDALNSKTDSLTTAVTSCVSS